jgi:hypothetical protein
MSPTRRSRLVLRPHRVCGRNGYVPGSILVSTGGMHRPATRERLNPFRPGAEELTIELNLDRQNRYEPQLVPSCRIWIWGDFRKAGVSAAFAANAPLHGIVLPDFEKTACHPPPDRLSFTLCERLVFKPNSPMMRKSEN